MESFWQLGDELRGLQKVPEDQQWSAMTSKLAELTKTGGARTNNLHLTRASSETTSKEKSAFIDYNNFDDLSLSSMNLDCKTNDIMGKNVYRNNMYGMNTMYKNDTNTIIAKNMKLHNTNKFVGGNNNLEMRIYNNNNGEDNKVNAGNNNSNGNVDKRFKTLPLAEMLPRNETLGGYIFVCNNDTMQEDLKRMLFGLPPRYRDSVRAITPGLPLFLYNYTTHQLHGIFEAASFGGTNIDPTAWEDKKCKGESRFPAQVRIRVRTICRALEEDSFRPVLHHYDGPKFRLELSIPETLQLLDLCKQASE